MIEILGKGVGSVYTEKNRFEFFSKSYEATSSVCNTIYNVV